MLKLENVKKQYQDFTLDCSVEVRDGCVTGLIGSNGAGKSTTFKAALGLIRIDAGQVEIFGKPLGESKNKERQKIGVVLADSGFSQYLSIKDILPMLENLYDDFDREMFVRQCERFHLPLNKKIKEFSTGMRRKLQVLAAISHNAELLILDEPTSGLDPVSRENLLEIFMSLCDRGKTILFSTHITSDLDKCADNIIYIRNGQIVEQSALSEFVNTYRLVEYGENELTPEQMDKLIGKRRNKSGWSSLIRSKEAANFPGNISEADLDGIMVHLESEGKV